MPASSAASADRLKLAALLLLLGLLAAALWQLPAVQRAIAIWAPWLLLIPLAGWAGRRFAARRAAAAPHWMAHALLALALLLGAQGMRWALAPVARAMEPLPLRALEALPSEVNGEGLLRPAERRRGPPLVAQLLVDLLLYGVSAALGHALALTAAARERNAQRLRAEAELARARLQTLQLQLNPHFLFNALNGIAGLIHVDPRSADAMLADLARLLRGSLDRTEQPEVDLAEELRLLDAYLAIERRRFGPRLKIEMDIDPECLAARLPTLLLQPLAENALVHGVGAHAGPGRLSLRARRVGANLVLEIADSGPGLDPDAAEGVGLANTRSRLMQLYPGRHRLALTGHASGAQVRIELPFRTDPPPAGDR